MTIRTGCEQFLADGTYRRFGQRVGLICNPTTVDSQLRHLALTLRNLPDVELVRLFAPEHGIWGTEQDMIAVNESIDPIIGIPVTSLYGTTEDSLRPPIETLVDLDCIIFDIQDIGSRYYTFIYTMMLCMEVAALVGTHFVVLDRPNPIGGAVEGNLVQPELSSFVGMHPIATRHGMTPGELARMFAAERHMDLELTVIPLKNWSRMSTYRDTGLPWVLPSPNMPTPETALVYPGQCLLEGTNVSEGRGTTRPFELFGAPWIEPVILAEELAKQQLPGVMFRPLYIQPTFHKFRGQRCGGLQIHVHQPALFQPLRTSITLLSTLYRLWPADLQWRTEVYEFVGDRLAIDLLFGDGRIRRAIEDGQEPNDIMDMMEADRLSFIERRAEFLLYPEIST
ncbi:MAG: DUF1343 domain-containing protein [Myxococcales bacterium]|nr:DUF1343 domain-containing protein [Myxococcales bacterium]